MLNDLFNGYIRGVIDIYRVEKMIIKMCIDSLSQLPVENWLGIYSRPPKFTANLKVKS